MGSSTRHTDSDLPAWLPHVANSLDEFVWITDCAADRVVHANPPFLRFLGGEVPEGSGLGLLMDRVVADDAPTLRKARSRLPDAAYELEYRLTIPAARGEGSRIARIRERACGCGASLVMHVARDVSWQFDTTAQLQAEMDRRADAERNLSEATARLEAMLSTANDPVISIDEQSRIVDWNQAAERVFGWSAQEAIGHVLTELIIPPEHRAMHQAGIEQFLRDGTAQIFNRRVETFALRRSGEAFDVELSVWPVRTASGYTFSSFVRDISRRKAAARALAESEAKYRKVVENVNEGILVTASGRILYANPKALDITGQTEDTALSTPFTEFIHPEDRERVVSNHMRRLRGEPVENYYHFRVIHADGRERWVEISAVVFEWQGAPATLNFLSDVTERLRAEQDMRTALARERELSALKSRFVAVASHEFRTPLAGILSSVELLESYGNRLPDEDRQELVQQIRTAVSRMNGMVEQVLLTSKLESGRFEFDPKPLSVPQLLVQLAAEMDQSTPQGRRIAMRCDGLDAARLVDSQLVRHILVNLLSNALKYSAPDTEVDCHAVPGEGSELHLSVRDRGIGIPAGDLPRLFESFHRGTNVGSIQGTGIGLHIVSECVILHRGSIEVDSEPGRGTTFRVRLQAPIAGA